MRKVLILILASTLNLGFIASPAHAFTKPKPNEACATLGDFGIADGKMMTCTANGSHLRWQLNPNFIANGLCSSWTPGEKNVWAELQLMVKGVWQTQALPVAFTPGPPCDNTKVNSSIPWIALPKKIADGTKYRWIHGAIGKDGHGGPLYAQGYADPTFTFTAASMKSKYLKIYQAIEAPIYGPHAYAALIKANAPTSTQPAQAAQTNTIPPTPTPSASSTPTPSASSTPTTTPSSSATTASATVYVAKDQKKVRHLVANEGCANPGNTTAIVQAQVDGKWLPIKPINTGWTVNPTACPIAQLGKKDSLAWVDVYLDPGVTYRWYFNGEVNIKNHDSNGFGFSESQSIALPTPVVTPHAALGGYGLTWSNITAHVADISAAAYTDAHATLARNASLPSATDVFQEYISPGALQIYPQAENAPNLMKRTFTLFANYPHAQHVFYAATTQEEKATTFAKLATFYPSNPFMQDSIDSMYGINTNEPAGSVFTRPTCNGQDTGRNTVDWQHPGAAAAVTWNFCPSNNPRIHIESDHGAAHEYAHTIQLQIYKNGNLGQLQPCWMTEGEVEWAQTAVSSTFDEYIDMEHFHPYYLTATGLNYSQPTQQSWTAAELDTYFKGAILPGCGDTPIYALAYSAGAIAIEALVALGGSESFFAVDQRISNGESFTDAFNEVYGVTWDYAEPILAEVVAQKLTHVNQADASTYQTRPTS